MQLWHLSRHKDNYEVVLVEVPGWVVALTNAVEAVDSRLNHALCGAPDWVWRIPAGKPVYQEDEDGRWLSNSLGSVLHDAFNRVLFLDDKYGREIRRISISHDEAVALGWDLDI